MSVTAHLDVLEKKHDKLKMQIENAYAHHLSDTELSQLKKEKLRLKDEIFSFKRSFDTVETREKVAA